MLYIVVDQAHIFPRVKAEEIEWHVGQAFPVEGSQIEAIKLIQADSDELAFIHWLMDDIPRSTTCRSMAWYGDIAKSIAFALWSYRGPVPNDLKSPSN